jgi:predicted TIM-barrel fold metal-dependent hydrolase
MDFFDCNCMIGRFSQPLPGQFWDVDSLEREMDRCGTARALVFHSLGKELDPATGNAALMRELAGRTRLAPCWVVMPPDTGEMPPPHTLCAEMRSRGVRAVRLFPTIHNFSLAEWCARDLFAALAHHHIPVFVDHTETNWDAIHAVCEAHPGLPLVLLRVNYRSHRFLYPLLARHRNLHLEIGLFVAHDALAECARRHGAERLLFGSAMPHFAPGGPMASIAYAGISAAEKSLIAGGNLRRLLGEES